MASPSAQSQDGTPAELSAQSALPPGTLPKWMSDPGDPRSLASCHGGQFRELALGAFRELALDLADEHERILREAVTGAKQERSSSTFAATKGEIAPKDIEVGVTPRARKSVRALDDLIAGEAELSPIVSTARSFTAQRTRSKSTVIAMERASTEKSIMPRRTSSANQDLELLPLWVVEHGVANTVRRGHKNASNANLDSVIIPTLSSEEEPQAREEYDGILKPFIGYPNSPKRFAWDMFGAFLILWDLFTVPLAVFEPPDTPFTLTIDWICQVFWTLNILATFTCGYVERGVMVMSPRPIAINYLKTWLLLDIIVVVPDWIFTTVWLTGRGDDSDAGSSVRTLRFVRLVRSLRIMRMLKLKRLLNAINDALDSEYLTIITNIIKNMTWLCAVNHFISCAWFGLTKLGPRTTWVTEHHFDTDDWAHQYWVAFHWSITQFTPASMHVQPQNVVERVFAVLVVIFALIGFAYIVGSITGSLTQIRSMQEEYAKQFWSLRRYMKKNCVPRELNFRIQRYLEHAWKKQQTTAPPSNLKLLTLLSEQLNMELQSAICVPHLVLHPLFEHLRDNPQGFEGAEMTMQRLAVKAISRKLLARGDSLFLLNEAATHMSLVTAGRLRYTRGGDDADAVEVHPGEFWVAEPVLWASRWMHRGALMSASESELFMLDGTKFADTVALNPTIHQEVADYAVRFMKWLIAQPASGLDDLLNRELLEGAFGTTSWKLRGL